MKVTVADVAQIMEEIAPIHLAEDWDNAGLQVGGNDWPVKRIWVALDPTPEVVAAACEHKVDLLITHHPLIFSALKTIDFGTPLGKIIHLTAKHKTSIFSAHTNLDNAHNGINDILAKKVGLKNVKILRPLNTHGLYKYEDMPYDIYPLFVKDDTNGVGRIGDLSGNWRLSSFADYIRKKFGIHSIKVAGDPDLIIDRVAVCSGSGSSLINDFISSGAQVFVSGDLRYHDARSVEQEGLAIIDIGHFVSEFIIVDELKKRLRKIFAEKQIDASVEACSVERDPYWLPVNG